MTAMTETKSSSIGAIGWFLLGLYVVSGVLQPTIIMNLKSQGAADKKTFIPLLSNYIGMCFAVLMPGAKWEGAINWGAIVRVGLVDVFSQALCIYGMILAGSMTYTVIYASVTIFTAIASKFILGKSLHNMQWVGCSLVTAGIAVSCLNNLNSSPAPSVAAVDASGSNDVLMGSLIVLIGAIGHAITYVLNEKTLKQSKDAVSPELLCSLIGMFGTLVVSMWEIFYIYPNRQTLIWDSIASANGDLYNIELYYVLLTFFNLAHAYSFFRLLRLIGSVTTGVMKGLKSTLIFITSHLVFCSHTNPEQCFTWVKGASMAIVISGVFLYSYYKQDPNKKPQEESEATSLMADGAQTQTQVV